MCSPMYNFHNTSSIYLHMGVLIHARYSFVVSKWPVVSQWSAISLTNSYQLVTTGQMVSL
jgi:hypothetical protein